MKYETISVIFVLIMLPISIVLSYYIQTQTDTLVLETTYQTKLNDSTYDAIAAYQMNSLNTQQVSGESVKSYVLASVNTFFTTLATNFGMSSASKSNLLQYVPAILFTTYDGYYIYSPTYMPKIATNPNTGVGLTDSRNRLIYLKKGKKVDISDLIITNPETGEGSFNRSNFDSNKYTVNSEDSMVQYETDYMLKPFIYYSAQYYKENNFDFIASYSLDNYVTLYGTKSNNRDSGNFVTDEFTKSGYLIDPNKISLSGNLFIKLLAKADDETGPNPDSVSAADILKPGGTTTDLERVAESNYLDFDPQQNSTKNNIRYLAINISNSDSYNFVNYYQFQEDTLYSAFEKNYYPNKAATGKPGFRTQTGDQIISDTLEIYKLTNGDQGNYYKQNLLYNQSAYSDLVVKYDDVIIDDDDAKQYYIKAYFFSQWVQNNLSDVSDEYTVELQDDTRNSNYYTKFKDNDDRFIFRISNVADNNPESDTSIFVQHKNDVIKNSIQYNLNLAISTYNNNHGVGNEEIDNGAGFQLPVLKSEDWDSVLNNVCMVSFMQGMPCGLTIFNNYAVVKSNNNNTSASIENMYFTQEIGSKYKSDKPYHKFDCADLAVPAPSGDIYEADQSANFKYDAKRINTKIAAVNNNNIVCFYDSSTNKYYNYINIADANPSTLSQFGDDLTIGDEIVEPERIEELSKLPTGTEMKYLYDHQNESCYKCIISGSYTPVIKIYNGKIYKSYVTADNTLIINIGTDSSPYWILDTGEMYVNPLNNTNSPNGGDYIITDAEFARRKKSIYTYLAKIRNNLYKTNDYVNR